MPRRIEIELTSTRPEGTWTWRAAGAKEPKGVVDGSLLYDGAKVGDVLKAEADFEIDGITIVSVAAPKVDARRDPERLEIIGPSRPDTPGVTTQLTGRSERRGPGRRREGDQRPRREGDQRGARDAGRGPDRRQRPRPSADEEPSKPAGDAAPREGSRHAAHRPSRSGSAKPSGREGSNRSDRSDLREKRLNPGHAHRHAILESLAPEQRPVAEQVLRGGIPAVRTALHLEREKAAAEGRPAPNTDQLIAMAEDLLPRLKAAEWRDRAEAAVKSSDEISIRDLRSVVAGADVARDDETRSLAVTLREALDRRIAGLRTEWSEEITKQLDGGRVVRALRLSARPPEPAARLDDELAKRLSDAAGEAMSSGTPPDLWMALLEAAVASPVRRTISPSGLPSEGTQDVRQAALQQSGRIPALAAMLGVSIPPPPARKPPAERPPASKETSSGPASEPRKDS